ncbi:MAG: molybdopterin molybdotransferase MoeA [Phycisphaeraceae bacterium]|nr:molybdopterin molybdotransferase MoeA [Phycisphaeraceae bacterium]
MIAFDKAYDKMMAQSVSWALETVSLDQALGRILTEDVLSDMDMPPFNKSAMDGYACRRDDLGRPLDVVENIPAGHLPQKVIGPGQCSKIMTGAPVPEGADCVIMVEKTESVADQTIRVTDQDAADHICLKGEDIRAGDRILERGDRIGPAHVAMLASAGCVTPRVSRQARVGVIATGSELVEPGLAPDPAQIRNSNSYQLCAQVSHMGATPQYYGIVEDKAEVIHDAIAKAKAQNDVILLSGGVSMGDFDLVPDVLKDNGFEFLFDSVAMQPGRPTIFGRSGTTFCFGLPGNPVSTYVVFEIMVKPFLYQLMGHAYKAPCVTAILDQPIKRRKASRLSSLPVRFAGPGRVCPIDYHGSAHIGAMARAQGLITVPEGTLEISKGSEVYVRPL